MAFVVYGVTVVTATARGVHAADISRD